MADRVQFILDLIDKLTAPARRMVGGLSSVKKATDDVKKATEGADSIVERFGLTLSKLNIAARNAEGPFPRLVGTLTKAHGGVWEMGNAAMWAGGKLIEFGTASLAFAAGAEAYALHAEDFKRKTLAALEIIEGTREKAEATYGTLRTMSDKAGLPTEQLSEMYKTLRATGYEAKTVQDIMAAGFDVETAKAGGGEQLAHVFAQMKEMGKFDSKELKKVLRGTTIGEDELAKVISTLEGPAKGKTVAAIRAMMEAGQIPAETGATAILETIRNKFDKGGALGTASIAVQGKSLTGILTTLKNRIDDTLADTVSSGPVTDALGTVVSLLDKTTPAGQAVRASLSEAFGDVAKAIKEVATPGNLGTMIKTAVSLASAVISVGAAFGGGFMSGLTGTLKPLMDVIRLSDDGTGRANLMAAAFGMLGKVLGFLVALAVYAAVGLGAIGIGVAEFVKLVWKALVTLPENLIAIGKWVGEWFASQWKAFKDWGGAIIDGLVQGVKDKVAAVKGVFVDLGKSITNTFTGSSDGMDIHSPSRLFKKYGIYTVQGFVEGVDAENDNASAAIASISSTAPSASSSSPRSRAGASFGPITIHVTVQGGRDADETGRHVGEAVEQRIVGLLEQFGLGDGSEVAA